MATITLPSKKVTNENPFYQMRGALAMLQQMPKLGDNPSKTQVFSLLNTGFNECNTKEKLQLFYSLLFSFGDISNREHNLFRKENMKDVDDGGNSMRKIFIFCLEWLLAKNAKQYYAFLPILGEYYNLDACGMLWQNTTDRYKGTLKETLRLNVDAEAITDYIASVLKSTKTSDNDKKLWAKWLWHIPTNTRQRKFIVTEQGLKSVQKKHNKDAKVGDVISGKRDKQSFTKEKDKWTLECIKLLSDKMGWIIAKHERNIEFVGYKQFKKLFLADSEATMFSQAKIKELDKTQLFDWFDQLPSGARYRTQCRLVQKEGDKFTPKTKWIADNGTNIGSVYIDWLNSKEKAQQAVRNLSEEDKVKMAKEKPEELKQMVKAAKVNTGAGTLMDAISDFFKSASTVQEIDLRAQSILDKINVQVPVLIINDCSGSMGSGSITHNGSQFVARNMAALATTIFMLKNPSQDAKDFFIRFDSITEIITPGQNVAAAGSNRFMQNKEVIVPQLIDRTKPFSWNYTSVSQYVIARGATNISTITGALKDWTEQDTIMKQEKIEMIQSYPVILVISDGDLNSQQTPTASLARFQQEMRQYFGWDGLVVMWDVKQQSSETSKFDDLENVIYYGGCNPNILNQIFRNIHDLDVIDIYTPLLSMYKSNRYTPVRDLVL